MTPPLDPFHQLFRHSARFERLETGIIKTPFVCSCRLCRGVTKMQSRVVFLASAVATFEINPRAFLINISVSGARVAPLPSRIRKSSSRKRVITRRHLMLPRQAAAFEGSRRLQHNFDVHRLTLHRHSLKKVYKMIS